jgi:hypothetical protein
MAGGLLILGGEMTHREFLIWLQPRLDRASTTGLGREGVGEIRKELAKMRKSGALQPFASRLESLLSKQSTLDAKTVAGLVNEVRSELAPPREKTVVLSSLSDRDDE